LKEDLRMCPYCRNLPPEGKIWADFDAHRRRCLVRQKAKQVKPVGSEPKLEPGKIDLGVFDTLRDLFKDVK
jgi:hypothetical protein